MKLRLNKIVLIPIKRHVFPVQKFKSFGLTNILKQF